MMPVRAPRIHTLGLVLVFAAAGCSTLRSAEPTPAASVQVSERLFFGQSIPGGGAVSEQDWTAFLRDVITPRFPQGLTVWKGEGQWLEAAGVLAREPVIVVEIVHAPGADLESSLAAISQEYKRRFRGEAVLRVTATVRQRLYEE
jgi:hypothetical protein